MKNFAHIFTTFCLGMLLGLLLFGGDSLIKSLDHSAPLTVGSGGGTIGTLDMWKSDGTNITQRTGNKPIKITGWTPGGCVQLGIDNVATTTGAACGSGTGGGGFSTTSAAYFISQNRDWSIVANTFLAPTTTLGIIVSASSTFNNSTTTFAGYINVLGSTNSTSTFNGNVEVKGNLRDDSITNSLSLADAIGVFQPYGGTTCTNQFVRSLNGAGVASCNTVDISADTNLTAATPIIMQGDQITWGGISTTTNASGGTFAAWNNAGVLYSVASSSLVANPSGSVGSTAATNGTATTFMRSDASPPCTTATASVPGCLAAADFTLFTSKQVSIGATTTNPFMATYFIATSSGTVTVPAFSMTSGVGLYQIGANSLGITNGVSGLTWDGTMFAPNTTAVRTLGGASNVWNKAFVNFASTTAISTTNFFSTTASTTYLTVASSSALLWANSSGAVTGTSTLAWNYGGTGLNTVGSAGQVLTIVNSVPAWAAAVAAGSASSTLKSDINQFTGVNYFNGGLVSPASTTIGAANSTTTLLGNILIGAAANAGLVLGTTTPLQVTCNVNSFCQTLLWNSNTGSNASTDMVFNNNLSTATTYFANVGINGSNFTQPLFSGERPNDLYVSASDGGIDFSLASTTGSNASTSFRWLTRGNQSSNIRMEMFADGRLVLATSTPMQSVFGIASSTVPQLALLDGMAANSAWTMRAISNNFYLATSTAVATSTVASFSINGISGVATFPQTPLFQNGIFVNASSTFTGAVWHMLQMGVGTSTTFAPWIGFNVATSTTFTGNIGQTYASTTPNMTNSVIDFNLGNSQRIFATSTLTIELNATSSHPLDGMRAILKICQDSTGGRSVTFNTYSSGFLSFTMGTPTPSTAAGTGFMYGMVYDAYRQVYDVVAATSTPRRSCTPL